MDALPHLPTVKLESLRQYSRNYRAHPLRVCAGHSEPFFIISAPRSGSTLLRRCISSHSQLHIPPETHVLAEVIRAYRQHRHHAWPSLVRFALAPLVFQEHFKWFNVDPHLIAGEADELPGEERSCAGLLDVFYRAHSKQAGKDCHLWGEKSPRNVYCLDDLLQVFPRARFILLVRDGVDAVASMVQNELAEDLLGGCRRWKDAVDSMESFKTRHTTSPRLAVRYEEFVANPEPILRSICTFLGVGFEEGMDASHIDASQMPDIGAAAHHEAVAQPIFETSIGRGRKELSKRDEELLRRELGTRLSHLGY